MASLRTLLIAGTVVLVALPGMAQLRPPVWDPGLAPLPPYDIPVPTGAIVNVDAADPGASERGSDTGTFTFSRTGDTSNPLLVAYAVVGSASNGVDFELLSGSVIIPARSSSTELPLIPIDDCRLEPTETATLRLLPSPTEAYATGQAASATVGITDGSSVIRMIAIDTEASERGPDSATVTIECAAPRMGPPLTLNYSIGGTAANRADYLPLSGSATIATGTNSTTFSIVPVDDTLVENTETVVLTLLPEFVESLNAAGRTIPDYTIGAENSVTVSITDNDLPLPSVTILATDPAATETGPDTGTFTVTRTGNTSSPLAVAYTITGSASNGIDFQALSGSVTIPPGSAATGLPITPIDDCRIEPTETVTLRLVGDPNALYLTGQSGSATVNIADGSSLIRMIAVDTEASERGPDSATVTIECAAPRIGQPLTLNYSLAGTATNGVDYAPLAGAATIAAGTNRVTVNIVPIDDDRVESTETVVLTLTTGAGGATGPEYTIGTGNSVTVRIADNDDPLPTLTVLTTDPTASESGPDPGTFTLARTGDTTGPLAIRYTLTGSAANGGDYVSLSGSLTISANAESAIIEVVPLDDNVVESVETVVLTLESGPGYTVGASGSATLTITDNDQPTVTILALDPDASETGPDMGGFRITRTGDTSNPLSVAYSLGGSASPGLDYIAPDSVTIPAGVDSITMDIIPIDDDLPEVPEVVRLTLRPHSAYAIAAPASAEISIADNDGEVVLEITGLPEVINGADGAEPQQFDVRLDQPISRPLTGRLSLTFTPDPALAIPRGEDPDVRFSTGGREAGFTVPPGTTFAANLPLVMTGTLVGTITLEADTEDGTTAIRSIWVAPGPPRIQNVELRPSSDGFDVHVIGFSAALSVTQATFQFQGTNLGGQPASLNVETRFLDWYRSAASEASGSMFEYIQPVRVNGDRNAIRSVTVTLGNRSGTSNAASDTVD